jgi:hypothetical protein
MKVLIIDTDSPYALGRLYHNAAVKLGIYSDYKTNDEILRVKKFSKDNLLKYLEHSNYKIKWNQKLFELIQKNKYDIVIFFRLSPVSSSTILHFRYLYNIKFVIIWPDSILFLKNNLLDTLQNVNLIASYSEKDVSIFESLKCDNARFIPLGYDQEIYNSQDLEKVFDISFLGLKQNYREDFIHQFSKNTDRKIFVSGPNWKNFKSKNLHISNKTFHSNEACAVYNSSFISLNIVDPTNYPSANMRFFEINGCNTIQLSNKIPEFMNEFECDSGNLYFQSVEDAGTLVNNFWDYNFNINSRVKIMRERHTYQTRLNDIISSIN